MFASMLALRDPRVGALQRAVRLGAIHAVVLAALLGPPRVESQGSPRDSAGRDSLPRAMLPPVTVTRTVGSASAAPYAAAAIPREEIARGRATLGLDEAILTIPGVHVANRYNPSLDQRVSIRGFGARSAFGVRGVKVLLDGIPQTLPDGQGQLTSIELGDIQRIEVLRGAASALYGNAGGGVLRLESAAPLGTPAVSGSLTGGSFGLTKWRVAADAPLPGGDVHVIASHTQADGFRAHSAMERRHAGLRLRRWLSPASRLVVHAAVTQDPFADNPGALTAAEMAADPVQADPRTVQTGAGKAVNQALAGAAYERASGSGSRWTVAAFALARDLENPQTFAQIFLDRWAYGSRIEGTLPVRRLPLEPIATLGVETQWQRDDRLNRSLDGSAITLDQFERVHELGAFAQVLVPLVPAARIVLAGRFDRVAFAIHDRLLLDGDQSGDRVMSAASWAVGAAWDVREWLRPYANVATAFETPTTTELVNRPDGLGGLNPELDPQRATNYEVGLRGTIRKLTYELAAFQADVRDELIPFESSVQPGRRFFRNAGLARHRGIEMGGRVDLPWKVSALATYTYADYRFVEFRTESDTLDGRRIPGVPRHQWHGSVRYGGGPAWAAVDATYLSSLYADDANTAVADAWTVVTLRAGAEFAWGAARVAPFVSVLNVFDERYAGSVVVNARGGRYYEPAPGRNVVLGAEVRFSR